MGGRRRRHQDSSLLQDACAAIEPGKCLWLSAITAFWSSRKPKLHGGVTPETAARFAIRAKARTRFETIMVRPGCGAQQAEVALRKRIQFAGPAHRCVIGGPQADPWKRGQPSDAFIQIALVTKQRRICPGRSAYRERAPRSISGLTTAVARDHPRQRALTARETRV
jgi:hypothetical protein